MYAELLWPNRPLKVDFMRDRVGSELNAWPFTPPTRRRGWAETTPAIAEAIRGVCCGESPWPLVLSGECGSGKTLGALALCDRVFDSIFTALPDLCRLLRQAAEGRFRSSSGYEVSDVEIWRSWERANLAVLDEVGTRESVTDFQYETAKKAIDSRLDHERPLIVISNLGLDDLARVYDDRIASRLAEGTVAVAHGDRRLRTIATIDGKTPRLNLAM